MEKVVLEQMRANTVFTQDWNRRLQTTAMGCFCLPACHPPQDRKLVQASDLTCQGSACCSPIQDG